MPERRTPVLMGTVLRNSDDISFMWTRNAPLDRKRQASEALLPCRADGPGRKILLNAALNRRMEALPLNGDVSNIKQSLAVE